MRNPNRHPGERRDPYDLTDIFHGSRIALRLSGMTILLVFLSLSVSAVAEDAPAPEEQAAQAQQTEPAAGKEGPSPAFRYAPDFCDFEISFPEAPFKTKRCPQGPGSCYELTSYTMVYDLRTTVDISVTCNPSTQESFEHYTEQVMRAALEGMVTRKSIEEYKIGFIDEGTVRQATLTGTGTIGRQSKIYTAQLWSGPHSLLTVQAELVGSAHEQADKVFGDILRSIHGKEGKYLPKPDPAKTHN